MNTTLNTVKEILRDGDSLFVQCTADGDLRCTNCGAISQISTQSLPSMTGAGHDDSITCDACGSTERSIPFSQDRAATRTVRVEVQIHDTQIDVTCWSAPDETNADLERVVALVGRHLGLDLALTEIDDQWAIRQLDPDGTEVRLSVARSFCTALSGITRRRVTWREPARF